MNSIYVCAASLCCTLVVCAVIRLIVPTGNTERIMSVVLSVFVLCSIFSPAINIIKNMNPNVEEKDLNITEKEVYLMQDKRVIEETANYINEYVYNLLCSKDVDCSSVKTILATNENRGIYIKEINIYLNKDDADKAKFVKEWITELLGIEPKVSEC